MGGAVSSGKDNDELIDNLMGGNYIRTRPVERVFRALDRAEYMTPEARDQAYRDQAWRNGPLHLSAPCIYSEVLEGLELQPGLSFLNIGCGTGYFSTMVGLLIGSSGISHGIEVHPFVVEYANKKLGQFIENSPTMDEFDFCEPKFYCGNGLCLAPLAAPYDRVYCGAGCPVEYENYFKQLLKVGGILVMPLGDNLVQVKRTGDKLWVSRNLLNVSFATLRVPTKDETSELIRLDEQCPPRLQVLARAAVRRAMRRALYSRHPQLREPPPAPPQPPGACPRRICIPIEDDSDVEGLNALHDLDNASGANEMNALLSLVLSMGQNRVAGALRFDSLDSPSDSSDNEDGGGGDDADDGDDGDDDHRDGLQDLPDLAFPRGLERAPRRGRTYTFQLRRQPRDDGSTTPPLPPPDKTDDTTGAKKGDIKCVASEVEIELGKEIAGTSRSDMEWERTEGKRESSSEEDTTETSKDQKRQKLDSGIGEEATTSGSSPEKSVAKSDVSDDDPIRSDTLSEEEPTGGRRRLQKRSRRHLGPQSSSSTECSDSEEETAGATAADGAGRRRKRRARSSSESSEPRSPRSDARRVRLSIMMKRGIKELPLPYAMKIYVNLGRCFALAGAGDDDALVPPEP